MNSDQASRAPLISRRSVLIGAVGALAVGAAGAYDQRGRLERLGHELGILEGRDLSIPSNPAEAEFATFASAAMRRDVGYGLYQPAGDTQAVIVCLHGRGNDERMAFDDVGVHRFVAERGLPIAVAAPDGGDHNYWHARRDGTDAGRMLVDEPIPMVTERTGAGAVALMGWSMGGYGALLAAARRPERFAAVAVGSPALWEHSGDTPDGAFDDAADFRRHDVFAARSDLERVPIRVDCGDSDSFASASRSFLQTVRSATGGLRPGYHDAGFWRSVVPDQLDFLSPFLA